MAGRVKVTGTMGVPLCLSSAVDEKSEQENIIYGDDSGAAIMLQCGRGELPARVLKPGDFQYVHDDHTDWVTQVQHYISALCRSRVQKRLADLALASNIPALCLIKCVVCS